MKEFWQAKSKSYYLLHNSPLRRYANLMRLVKNWPSYLLWKIRGYRSPEQLEVMLRNGFKFIVTKRTRVEFKLIFLRCDYIWPLPPIEPDTKQTIIDLGANIGYFTLFAGSCFPLSSILSVEPFPANLAALRQNVARNNIKRCQIIDWAVAGKRGKAVFGSSNTDDPFPTNARITSEKAIDGKHFVECETTTLDFLLDRFVSGDVALLKVDIEGAEYDVLYSASEATLGRIKRLAIETEDLDDDRMNTDALASYLRGKSFQVIEVTPHLLHAWRP